MPTATAVLSEDQDPSQPGDKALRPSGKATAAGRKKAGTSPPPPIPMPPQNDPDHSLQLFSLLENTDEIFFTHSSDLTLTRLNKNIRLLGYEPESLLGKNLSEIVCPEDLPRLLQQIEEHLQRKAAATNLRFRMRHQNGNWCWLNTSTQPVLDKEGNLLYIAGIARDITAQVKQENSILENEAKYRQLFFQHPLPHCIYDAGSGQILEVNQAAMLHYGYTHDEFLALTLNDIQAKAPEEEPDWDQMFASNTFFSRLGLHRKKDGALMEVETTVQATSIQGRPAFQTSINDITERRKAERELEASDTRYRMFIQQSAGGIWRFELKQPLHIASASKEEIIEHFYQNCYLAECNDSMAQMYGLEKKEDILGKDCEFFLPRHEPSSRDFFDEFISSNFRVKNSISFEKDVFGNSKVFLNNYSAHIEDGYIIRTWGTQRDITEMYQAEERVKYLANIVENASDAIFSTDPERNVMSWNKACEELFQFSAQEIIGKRLSDHITFEFQHTTYQHVFLHVIKAGGWKGEVSFVNRQGKRIYLLTSINIVEDKNGRPSSFILLSKDITQRREAEQISRESEERFRRLADSAPAMIWMTDENRQAAYANQTLIDFMPAETNLQQGWNAFIHPDDLPGTMAAIEQAYEQKATFSVEYRFLRRDSQYRWLLDRATPRFLEDGTFKGFIGISLDIDDRKTAEEQLLCEANRTTNILNSITDGFIALDNEGYILMWNRRMEQVFGVRAQDAIGRPVIQFFSSYEHTDAFPALQEAYRNKRSAQIEQFLPDKKMWVEIIMYPFAEGCFTYLKDISGRKRKALLMQLQKDVLSFDASPGTTLADTAQYLVSGIHKLLPDARISILKADDPGENLYPLASQNLPKAFSKALASIPISPSAGSCGAAAYGRKPVFCPEIDTDPLWKDYRKLMQQAGLKASASFPIVSNNQKVLAVFAFYYDHFFQPQQAEMEIIEHIIPVLLMIIEKKKAEEEIRLSNERFVLVNKATNEGIFDYHIPSGKTTWGEGFSRLFGYEISEPDTSGSFWKKKIHPEDKQVFQQIFNSLKSPGMVLLKGLEFRFQKANGRYAHVAGTGYIVRNPEGRPLRIVGSMRDVSGQKKMEEKLIREMMNKQKAIHKASLEGSEKEREAISRELHDNVNQILSATKLYLEIARKEEDKRELFIEKSIRFILSSITEIRKLSRSLAAPALGDLGLKSAIETLVQEIQTTEKIKICYFYSPELPASFDDTLNLTLYRIIQEQLTNILKYAKTETAFIQLGKKGPNLTLVIKDQGVGFDKRRVKKGLGLSNIANRASLMNGKVKITAAPGKGCVLTVSIPLPSGSEGGK